tara:strand:+ start:194 stop:610 length:417 start_codon:yes stop_codon:yes gene_type:complete
MDYNLEDTKKEKSNQNENSNLKLETFKDLIMYYQTSIRNVALTTAVSFAALGYSRFYRGKNKMYTVGLTFISVLLLTCSTLLNSLLYNSLQPYLQNPKYKDIKQWIVINKIFFVIHFSLLFFGLFTVYRLFTDKTFKN